MAIDLVAPRMEYLAQYADALRRGWSPDNLREAVRYRVATNAA